MIAYLKIKTNFFYFYQLYMDSVIKFVKNNSYTIVIVAIAIVAILIARKYYIKQEGLENVPEVKTEEKPVLGDEFPVQSEEVLPQSQEAKEFESQFPLGTGELSGKNFLAAGHNIGINTVSSSLRNANLQVRSDPYIEPQNVGPFLNSTITPDMNRKTFEIA